MLVFLWLMFETLNWLAWVVAYRRLHEVQLRTIAVLMCDLAAMQFCIFCLQQEHSFLYCLTAGLVKKRISLSSLPIFLCRTDSTLLLWKTHASKWNFVPMASLRYVWQENHIWAASQKTDLRQAATVVRKTGSKFGCPTCILGQWVARLQTAIFPPFQKVFWFCF